jgi:hypothetical protein
MQKGNKRKMLIQIEPELPKKQHLLDVNLPSPTKNLVRQLILANFKVKSFVLCRLVSAKMAKH